MTLTVYKLTYSSTCSVCEEGIESGQGIRLLQTMGGARTGLDFHTHCWRKALLMAGALSATELVEVNGVYLNPNDVPRNNVVSLPKDRPQAGKQIPKRRPL